MAEGSRWAGHLPQHGCRAGPASASGHPSHFHVPLSPPQALKASCAAHRGIGKSRYNEAWGPRGCVKLLECLI